MVVNKVVNKSKNPTRLKRGDAIKTQYAGVYYILDEKTKAKIWIARIKIDGIDTEQRVGRSDDELRTNAYMAHQKRMQLIAELKAGKSILKPKLLVKQ